MDKAPEFFENPDLEDPYTTVEPHRLCDMLVASGYDHNKTQELFLGFSEGFDICYREPEQRSKISNNIPLRIGNEVELWN